ncbi:MAG: hypothetical protein WBE86_16000 [Candidatus Acidiferrales bacterium]
MDENRLAEGVERIGRILVGILLKDMANAGQGDKILLLRGCGFKNAEIASMLGTSEDVVSSTVYAMKTKKKGRRKKKA